MINLHPKKQLGASTLMISALLLVTAGLIITFAGGYSALQQKTVKNEYNNNQAYEAAETGLEYALSFLQSNSGTVLASPSGGFVNYTIATTTLPNNATYSVVITNPTASDYSVLTMTSTGISADGSSTHIVSQQASNAGGAVSLQYAMTGQSNIISSGGITITGTNGLDAGGLFISSGQNNISSTNQNDAALASQTGAALFQSIFGMTPAAMKAKSTVYSSSGSVPWGSLSGVVWVDASVVSAGTITAGSAASPVILIVNGSFISSGTATINGILYVMGATTTSGNFNLNGGIVSQGQITMSGSTFAYSAPILQRVLTGSGGNYTKVPGSWRDF